MTIDFVTAIHEDFEQFVGQTFKVETPNGIMELKLDNVKPNEKVNIRDNHLELQGTFYPPRQPFALTFEGPREPVFAPDSYMVTTESGEEWFLFLSPFRQDHNCALYESVFS